METGGVEGDCQHSHKSKHTTILGLAIAGGVTGICFAFCLAACAANPKARARASTMLWSRDLPGATSEVPVPAAPAPAPPKPAPAAVPPTGFEGPQADLA